MEISHSGVVKLKIADYLHPDRLAIISMYGLSEEVLDDLKEGSRVSLANVVLQSFNKDGKLQFIYRKGSMVKVT